MKNAILACLIACILGACSKIKSTSNTQIPIRDSVLILKTQGLREFIKVADYWGDDTESYWAFER